jgi:predicted ATP-dependent protease
MRALRALEFGLKIKEKGYNIYVAGLAKDVDEFIKAASKEILKAFESEEYANRRNNTVKRFQEQREEMFTKINEQAQKKGLLIQGTPMGLVAIPIIDNKPISEDAFRQLDRKTRDAFTKRQLRLQDQLKKAGRQIAALEKKTNEMILKLDKDVASYTLNLLLEELEEKYHKIPEVLSYLKEMRDDMLDNLSLFRNEEQKKPEGMEMSFMPDHELKLRKYKVNVFVDNSQLKGAPIITELNPSYNNLFGRVEKEAQFGALVTDFTMIRSGSVHRANGGQATVSGSSPPGVSCPNLFHGISGSYS